MINTPLKSAKEIEQRKDFDTISWSITGSQKHRKSRAFIRAIKQQDRNFVRYIISCDESLASSDKFISRAIGQWALKFSLKKEYKDIVDLLLEQNFITKYGVNKAFLILLSLPKNKNLLKHLVDENIIDIDALDQTILFSALANKDKNMSLFILNLGAEYEDIKKSGKYKSKYSYTLNIAIIDFTFQKTTEGFARIEARELARKIAASLKEKQKEAQKEESNIDVITWSALDNNTIIKHENIKETGVKLQTIFNFEAKSIRNICCVPEKPSASFIVQNFEDMEDDTALFEAWHKLKGLGKNPVAFYGNDNFVVNKPHQRIKIEG